MCLFTQGGQGKSRVAGIFALMFTLNFAHGNNALRFMYTNEVTIIFVSRRHPTPSAVTLSSVKWTFLPQKRRHLKRFK
jgi:hypothetical protein